MKFKFKITEDTTIEDAEKELEILYNSSVVELPLTMWLKLQNSLEQNYKIVHVVPWKDLNILSSDTWQLLWGTCYS